MTALGYNAGLSTIGTGKVVITSVTNNTSINGISTNSGTFSFTPASTAGTTFLPYTTGNQYKIVPLEMDYSCKLTAGKKTIELPDGAKLIIDDLGNYKIEDKDAKVTYQANKIREFSPHINASDMLAKFVEYVGSIGVRQKEVLNLPIELFINWLIIEAAERDKDPIPEDVIPISKHPQFKLTVKPKCLSCGKYIPRKHLQNKFAFCNIEHGMKYANKIGLVKQPQKQLENLVY